MFRGTGKTVPLLLLSKQVPRCFCSGALRIVRILRLFQFVLFDKQLCDLYCVCSCALADLIAAAPEVDTVLIYEVAADPAYVYSILI